MTLPTGCHSSGCSGWSWCTTLVHQAWVPQYHISLTSDSTNMCKPLTIHSGSLQTKKNSSSCWYHLRAEVSRVSWVGLLFIGKSGAQNSQQRQNQLHSILGMALIGTRWRLRPFPCSQPRPESCSTRKEPLGVSQRPVPWLLNKSSSQSQIVHTDRPITWSSPSVFCNSMKIASWCEPGQHSKAGPSDRSMSLRATRPAESAKPAKSEGMKQVQNGEKKTWPKNLRAVKYVPSWGIAVQIAKWIVVSPRSTLPWIQVQPVLSPLRRT